MAALLCGKPGPGDGRGKETIRVRNAVEGIEASNEFVALRFDSFSIKGANISLGALTARGPRLLESVRFFSRYLTQPTI